MDLRVRSRFPFHPSTHGDQIHLTQDPLVFLALQTEILYDSITDLAEQAPRSYELINYKYMNEVLEMSFHHH